LIIFNKFGKIVTIILVISILTISIFLACGPKPTVKAVDDAPYNLKAVANNGTATLYWQTNRRENTPISGYNIYLAESAGTEGELYNSSPFPGDTDGDITRESYELPRLNNGIRYYAYVRTVRKDGSLSNPSPEVSFMPLQSGRLEISTNYTRDSSGYSFAKEKYTVARDFDNDFYIYINTDKAGISSPYRLHSSLRKTLIKFESDKNSAFEQTKPLIKGKTYILKTSDSGQVRMILLKLSHDNSNQSATFDYTYYPPGVEP
jgi:hypothetical protein